MGGVLFGLSIGSMSGILCSAWLVKRFGTRNVIPGHDVLRIDRDDDIKSGTLADIAPCSLPLVSASLGASFWFCGSGDKR